MSRKFTQVVLLMFLANLLWSCAGAGGASQSSKSKKIPAWARNAEHPQYPKALYWTGIGSATDLTEAADEARAEVAAQIKVRIKSVTTSTESELLESDREFYQSAFESSVQALVDASVQGIEIIESKQVGNDFYAFAVLSKFTYLGGLERELQDYSDQLSTLYTDAEGMLDKGDIFPAIGNLVDALELAPQVYPRQNFYNALADVNFNLPQHLQGAALISQIRSVLSDVNLTLVSGGNQTAKPGQRLPEPVIVKCMISRTNGSVPIANMPIKAAYESGEVTAKTSTDERGLATIKTSAIPGERPDAGSLRIALNIGRMPEIMGPELRKLELVVNYRIAGEVAAFAVIVKTADGKRISRVEDYLEKTVLAAGFRIDPTSKLVIEGQILPTDIREIELGGVPTYQAEVSLRLAVVDKSTGSKKGSIEVSKKMVHKNKNTASEKARDQVGSMVKRRALAQMLADALTK
ncbi:MAG: LPP20 family lipoprotein [Candidatus Marinimicrobia bacterium]|nr:LPP20 family lipoprotein [FCB group bacterium]MBL7026427.1 LPP20 family lipoprotein [Candidatus Neomarinimicrobiota bacterium]